MNENNSGRITINDVAEKAGVSVGTVSAVINQRRSVKARTRERVQRIIKELNFRPQGKAQTLRFQFNEKSIGLIVRKIDNPFYTALATGVKRYANKHGYIAYITSSESSHASEEDITRSFTLKEVSGAIIAPTLDGEAEIEHLFRLRSLNFPYVLLEEVPGIKANVVNINNSEAITEAVMYLIQCGHTRIIHFSGPENSTHTFERIAAFRQAFSESHFIFKKDMIIPCGGNFEDGYRVGLNYFKQIDHSQLPMAVVSYNDVSAIGLITALKETGLKVPRDVSVVGIDDIELARYWSPALTTIGVPIEKMGEQAAKMLIDIIESEEIPKIQTKTLHAELVIRETTCNVK